MAPIFRSRMSARISRDRHKQYVQDLEQDLHEAMMHINEMEMEVLRTRQENELLRMHLALYCGHGVHLPMLDPQALAMSLAGPRPMPQGPHNALIAATSSSDSVSGLKSLDIPGMPVGIPGMPMIGLRVPVFEPITSEEPEQALQSVMRILDG